MMKIYKLKTRLTIVLACLMMSFGAWAQSILINPTTDGGFELPGGFAGNGWTLVNHTTNTWNTGTLTFASGANGAYISNDGGATESYLNALSQTSHFYKDVVIPAGETAISLGFSHKGTGEAGWDRMLVYTATTGVTPVAGTPASNSTVLAGATLVYTSPINATYQNVTMILPASLAGTTVRLIITWQNDGSLGANPAAAIDNISFVSQAPAPLNGIYTIDNTIATSVTIPASGGNFNTFTEAVGYLNLHGVSGPVTFNVTSGLTFTEGPQIINATGTLANPIVFQKSVAGMNPVLLVTNGIGTTDAGFTINGGDYFSFNGIDVTDNTSNLTNTTKIEYGYFVRNFSATNGAQNNSITNTTISLDRSNTASRGILQGVPTAPTSAAGANSNNMYKNLTIRNVYAGIQLSGNATFPDLNTEVGTTACTAFNSIGNPSTPNDIGNAATATYGINATNQSGVKIYNNIIRNITNTGGQADGINIVTFQGTSSVYNNKIQTIRNAGAGSTTTVTGIRATHTTTGTHTLRMYNNSISEITSGFTGASSATRTIKGIFIAAGGGGVTQVYEIFNNNVSINGSASLNISNVCFETTSSSGPVYNLGNNIFANYTIAQGATSRHYCMFTPSATTFGPVGSTSNNNNLYIANDQGVSGFVGRGNTTDYATLANWQAGITTPAGIDATSLSIDPMFTNMTTDLHANALGLNGAGIAPPAYITADLDCATRTPDNDIGAYIINTCSGTPTAGSITGLSSICNGLGTTLNLTGATSGAGITYQWASSTVSGGPYTNMGTSTTQATGPMSSTTYYIVTTTCAFGSSASTAEYTLTVNSIPTVSVTPTSALYCNPGTAVALTGSGANTYSWAPSAGLSATTGTTVNATPASTTTYTVTGTDGNGCSNTATTVITSSPAVSVSSVTASPNPACVGSASSLMINAAQVTPAYCTAGATSTSFEKISNVTFGTINNTSAATAGYENFTAQSTNITAGVAVPISIGVSSAYATDDRIHVWVDMNNDGVFADPAENVLNLAISTFCPACAGTNTTVNGNITIPITAFNGSTRMRIRLQDQSSGANATPCGTSTYGQVEDYTVNISGGANNISYSWSPATFLSSTTVSNPTATPTAAGTTTYTAVATSLAGCSAQGTVALTANPLPTVTASSDDLDNTVCSGTMVTLSGGGASTYAWTGGVTDATPFSATTTTTYTVTGTDVNSCQNTATITLTVNALPTVTASSDDADNTVCSGTMVTLSGGGSSTYAWTGGVTNATAFPATATTTYTVTGTDVNSCQNTATITLTVNALPTVTASSNVTNDEVCVGGMATLTGGGASTYAWTSPVMDGVAFTPTMTDTYTVTGTDVNSCQNTATITLTVNALPTITASSDATNDEICVGNSVTLTGGGAVSYAWTSPVMDGVAFTPTMTDTYTVTGTDVNGCENTTTITITLNALPTVTASSDATNDEVCAGLMVTLNGAGADTYIWSDGGGVTGITDGASFAPSMTDTYTVTGTDLNGCENTATITITVNALPAVDLTPFASSVCDNGGPVTLVDGTPTGGMFSGLGVTGNMFDPSVTGQGMWTITYTVTDANNCNNSDSEVITVDLCTGIASNDSQVISLYPNPTTGMFTLNINNANTNHVVISIVDMQGKIVYNESDKNVSSQYNKQIDLSDLAKGIYYVKLNIGSDVQIQKLIVQ